MQDILVDTLTPIVHEPSIRAQLTGAMPMPQDPGYQVLIHMVGTYSKGHLVIRAMTYQLTPHADHCDGHVRRRIGRTRS